MEIGIGGRTFDGLQALVLGGGEPLVHVHEQLSQGRVHARGRVAEDGVLVPLHVSVHRLLRQKRHIWVSWTLDSLSQRGMCLLIYVPVPGPCSLRPFPWPPGCTRAAWRCESPRAGSGSGLAACDTRKQHAQKGQKNGPSKWTASHWHAASRCCRIVVGQWFVTHWAVTSCITWARCSSILRGT